jgi:hypothetical protein
MDIYRQFEKYETLQKEVIRGIASLKGVESIEEIDEDELWQFDEALGSGWKVYPHGEHLSCKNNESIKIELPLYVQGCVGIDPGHFNEYLLSLRVSDYSYQAIAQELEQLESIGKAKRVNPEATAAVWKLI